MSVTQHSPWTRRSVLCGLSAAVGTGVFGLKSRPAVAEPPPETSKIRLVYDPEVPILCYAPQYLVEDFLRLEGFTDITYARYEGAVSEHAILTRDSADFSAGLGSDHIVGVDTGAAIVVLGGLHAGCVEVFANDRVASIQNLKGKRVVIPGLGSLDHIFFSSVISFVGLDPANDIEWVVEPDYVKWPERLETNDVDVVSAFPPLNLELRENKVGHVILNTTLDDPWRHFFCCMIAGRQEFVEEYPVATKRAIRAFVKATQLCELDKEGAARRLVEYGIIDRQDWALTMLEEVPYGAWRDYDPADTVRFFALRLHEAGLVQRTPSEILERGTDFRFIDELRQELKL